MIESALILLFLTFVNPADPTGKSMYTAGVGAMEHDYFNNLPDTKYPNLVLPVAVYDSDKHVLEPSIYEATYSKDQRCLFLMQGGTVMAQFPVDKILTLDKEYKLPTAEAQIIGAHKILLIYRDGNIETDTTLYTP